MSPAAKALVSQKIEPPLPEITLPAEIDQLLRRREQVSGTPPVGDLFAGDAIILEMEQGRWVRGHEKIDRFLGFMWKKVRYVPKSYAVDRSAGFIAGNVRIGDTKTEHLNFILGLRKSPSGGWQIAAESFTKIPSPPYATVITADKVIEQLDEAGVRQGVLLSVGYWFRDAAGAQAENDWTVAEAARYADRLVPICGVNPTLDFAFQELERCAQIPSVRGIKIHLANAGIDLEQPEHRAKIRDFFAAANRAGMAIIVHIRPLGNYKREHAQLFLDEIMPAAPDVPVQIAHAANSAEALAVFAGAIAGGDPKAKNLYFDWGSVPVELMRKVGLRRFFFGTDMPINAANATIEEHWDRIQKSTLTDEELRIIAGNVPPYVK